uniref:FHA domain-containing protein n=1 Tax=Oryza nivara TaxID=4536 RepID=A0A0E0GG68_ORYNI
MAALDPPSELLVTPKTARKDEAASCNAATPPKPSPVSPEEMRAVARKFAEQPVQNPDDGVWAVLTAISKNARLRPEGMNILLSADEHYIGRAVQESSFKISSLQISGKHCKIYRDTVLGELNRNEPVPVFLKDSSSNGTFINWTRLKKTSPPTKLNHGDIISFVSAPHDNTSFAFVYREVNAVSRAENEVTILKRKSEDIHSERKRLKGLGIGSSDGPVSLDDVRRLEKSNAELREQLEEHVVTIETLRTQIKISEAQHEKKSNICELEAQLSEERDLRREERDKAAEDLKSALHKVNAEAQEEIKRQAEAHLRQQREQKEVISKLQESEKEIRLLVETLRSKLEDTRENLVTSEKKARELEAQLQDEQLVSANNQKKSDKLEMDLRKVKKELEHEKAAREEAWAKVSALELEIAATIRDLSIEKQRYQGARERIILRETQLRAFYSTTEEISSLFAKQQEQLKAMQRTLEDEENYENTIMGDDLNKVPLATVTADDARTRVNYSKNTMEASGASTENTQASEQSSSDDSKETEQQDDFTRVEGANTQEVECNSPEMATERFRSDSHGDLAATAPELEPTDTEQVPETESQAGNVGCGDHNSAPQRFSEMGGDTMQLDDEVQPQENDESILICKDRGQPQGNEEASLTLKDGIGHYSEEKLEVNCSERKHEDTQTRTIGTADLLASEVAGSWAVETGPSVNGENESPRSLGETTDHAGEQDENVRGSSAADALVNSDGQAAGSQSNIDHVISKITDHHRVLNAMIEIVDPDFRKQLPGSGVGKDDLMSDAETEEGSEANDTDSDSEEAMVEDSVG